MGVTAALMLGGAAISAAGSIQSGIAQKKAGEQNAQIYEAQARNIAEAQKITAGQYRTKENELRGQAITSAARGGLKISGSTANSISQSIMQLQMDNAYEQYNLQAKKNEAYNKAALERFKGKMAFQQGLMQAGTTALNAGVNYYDKYWKGANNSGWTWGSKTTSSGNNAWTWAKGQINKLRSSGTRLSGGLPTTNQQIYNASGNYIV